MSFFQFNRYVMLCCTISTALPNFLQAGANPNFQANTGYVGNNNAYEPDSQNQDDILRDPNIRTAFATHILLQRYFSELKEQKDSSLVSSDMRETYLQLLLIWLKTAKPIFNTLCNKDFDKVLTQEKSENAQPFGETIFQKLKTLLYLSPNGFEGLIPQNQWEIAPILGDFIKGGEFDSSVLLFLLNIGLENQSVHELEAQNQLQQQVINSKIDKLNANKAQTKALKEAYTQKHKGWFTSEEKILKKLDLKKSELAQYSSAEKQNQIWEKLDEIEKIGFREIIEETEEKTIQKEQEILNNKNKILKIYKKLDQSHWFDPEVQSNFWDNNGNDIHKLAFDIQHELENKQLDFNYDNFNSRDSRYQNSQNRPQFNRNENNQNDYGNQNNRDFNRSNDRNNRGSSRFNDWNMNNDLMRERSSNNRDRGSFNRDENNQNDYGTQNNRDFNRFNDRNMNNDPMRERSSNNRDRGSFNRNENNENYSNDRSSRDSSRFNDRGNRDSNRSNDRNMNNDPMRERSSNNRDRGSFNRNENNQNDYGNQNNRDFNRFNDRNMNNDPMRERSSNNRDRRSFNRNENNENYSNDRNMNNDHDQANRRDRNSNRSFGNRKSDRPASDNIRVEGNKIYINGPIEIIVHD